MRASDKRCNRCSQLLRTRTGNWTFCGMTKQQHNKIDLKLNIIIIDEVDEPNEINRHP